MMKPQPVRPSRETIAQALLEANATLSWREIGRQVGVSHDAILDWINTDRKFRAHNVLKFEAWYAQWASAQAVAPGAIADYWSAVRHGFNLATRAIEAALDEAGADITQMALREPHGPRDRATPSIVERQAKALRSAQAHHAKATGRRP